MQDPGYNDISDYGLNHDYKSHGLYRFNMMVDTTIFRHFSWTDEANKLYKKGFSWEKIFPSSDPIGISSSYAISKIVRHYPDGTTKVNPNDKISNDDVFDVPTLETTGYITPRYNFLERYLYDNTYVIDYVASNERRQLYNETMSAFNLDEDGNISSHDYAILGNFRDTLHTQIERQAEEFQEYNLRIADLLKVVYYETERAVTLKNMEKNSKERNEQLAIDWGGISSSLIYIYRDIQRGMSFDEIREGVEHEINQYNDYEPEIRKTVVKPFHLWENVYVPRDLLESTIDAYIALMINRTKVIDNALIFAKKILPVESLLEDFFRGGKIKSTYEYNAQSKHQEETVDHAQNSDWIIETFKTQRKDSDSQNKAALKTIDLYWKKFGLRMAPITIYRFMGIYD